VSWDDVLSFAEEDERVVGLVLLGSRGRGIGVDDASDHDACLVLRDEDAVDEARRRFPTRHGDPVEVLAMTVEELDAFGELGSLDEVHRYAFVHVTPLVDRSGGELQRVLDAKELLGPLDAAMIARAAIDEATNAVYRSLRYGTALDGAEAVAPLLGAVFAVDRRIRPFHKYLAWELEHHPLPGWSPADVAGLLAGVARGEHAALHEAFRRLEAAARRTGLDDVVEGWEPDVGWLRGDEPYRRAR
jgi:hypothetical protein